MVHHLTYSGGTMSKKDLIQSRLGGTVSKKKAKLLFHRKQQRPNQFSTVSKKDQTKLQP